MGYMASKLVNFAIVLSLVIAGFVVARTVILEEDSCFCTPSEDDISGTILPFETVSSGYDGPEEMEFLVIREYAELSDFWRSFKGMNASIPSMVEGEEMIVVVFGGSRPTPCSDIRITTIVEDDDHIDVLITDSYPSEYSGYITAMGYPYHIVRTEYSEKEVIFIVCEHEM